MRWPQSRSCISHSGFTLLECLVALVVVAIGVMSIAVCLSTSSVMNWRAQRLAIAFGENMRMMEKIREYNGPGTNFQSWITSTSTTAGDETNGVVNRTGVSSTVNGSTTTITSKLANTMLNNNTQTITITSFTDANNPTMSQFLTNVSITTTWLSDTKTTRSNTLAATFVTRQF